ncbi:MAG: L,D-transpeptidase family protein [Bacteroidales bacterium]|jgi:lipoprotein-anchoring transpeptidase ErfK/SrfK|nr:L,D-transpeptidase family protein [Bacteroidales bacterium]
MEKIWKIVLISSGGVIVIMLTLFLMVHYVPEPPVAKVESARTALSEAWKNRADSYSMKLFKEAKEYYDSAMVSWKQENNKYIYSRDYSKVVKYADLAVKRAIQASENSKSTTSDLSVNLQRRIKSTKNLITEITGKFTHYPLTQEVRNNISKGMLLLKESELAFNDGRYLQAEKKINESEELLKSSYEYANSNLKSYFRSYPEWKTLIDSTIAVSKTTRDYTILIDKFSRKVFVYLEGEIKFEYSAELGKNWAGDKQVRGDKATPEGMYRIAKKFKSDSTKYYKALLLDYPNDEDTALFEAAIAKGTLPRSAKIGGLIEIHGNGGKGTDWTNGCIALTDREMDSIFKIVKVGTPVTIVGSMYDLKHVLKR